ncbi:transcription factor GTE7-like isoform X1 [Zingiber officinale]|uniref:transcription factor GTE7-like isoform X1 n=1 Tax=Zingiber officinale TaxID=94328 RepID=UPI001C4D0AF0|nr:transcription factor GTE7-like isoform X1 [Zingiber officinale]XP_042465012.1 transcription factor GTE7-like isoform X1 [Zingiber officinale]XP_042465013.1 transcription factor GTE7-like isoform X1 [Zingiber officinale]XP_042465014.1 transcription factor GTE7-like isoform X1 [Zingiber officinale]XP_042465016.1 transcription factor GTE7-like isoform X1 [Zingiber officinale]XP_042465017.1 transcription factor GTE7-like isoform X1 [Zingiber officinale]
MASAILASSNEQHWREPNDYMRKNPISNPNPNPRSVLNFYAGDHAAAARFHAMEGDEAMPNCYAARSEDSSSLNRKLVRGLNSRDLVASGASRYASFHLSMLSKGERRELKRRLISELDQVRSLKSRIESREIQSSARSAGFSASGIYCGGREVTSSASIRDPMISKPSELFLNSHRDLRLQARSAELGKLLSSTMKKCGQILSKLMKNKQSGWFNSPVDVDGMGLHDYFQIIKMPMDLGTVKKKLNKGLYPSPAEFAADIRLTFNNALLYNPPGHVVHKFAEQFLLQFEGLFAPAFNKYENQRIALEQEMQKYQSPAMEMIVRNDPPPPPALSQASPVQAPSSPPALSPLLAPPQQLTRTPAKLPRPKAKDPIKRPMTLAEKQKLSEGLQSLPQDKMPQVLNIVTKRNAATSQNDDEVELDFDTMDTDTLWELDRFLCNFKKTVNKMRRHEAMAKGLIPPPATGQATLPPLPATDGAGGGAYMSPKAKLTTAEEEIDIGDDLPATNYPSVEIEKNAGCDSVSGSSDSDSSSSSDSDSDSTDSDSDNNDGRSPRNMEQPEACIDHGVNLHFGINGRIHLPFG